MSNFDPSTFLDVTLTVPTEKRPPIPVGDYQALITEVKSRAWNSKDGSKSGIALDAVLEIQLPSAVAELVKQLTIKINDSIMLDLTEAGSIDNSPGKNSKLRRYRDALDMNKPGDSFSPRMMTGRFIGVKIKHDPYEGEIYERVEAVSRAA